ncbi:helix-turn-helix domain-containing protein [Halostagnicola kamekurae]|uniref:Predicted DNA binding protein, contains HTH domain n=1 Tax=Halostagnicola kamekurae TaxID=619731 RepID=A0A1I6RPL4_9EURY|nr:helix-turn-helix domain-containing protein [Halostagnicola kamekurae]SFS66683.1 Predicted DNA binding protein, contains HTH domain [Halostagnicola kamekurae]
MTFVAEFTISSAEFSFGAVLREHPGLAIEFESVVPTHHGLMPFIFVWSDGNYDEIEPRIRSDRAVETVTEMDRFDDGRLYKVTWSDSVPGLADALLESRATLLEGIGTDEGWTFEIRFREQERIEAFQARVDEYDISLELERLRAELEVSTSTQYDLTDKQYETLITAFDAGYFENPKDATLEEIGDELGVSEAAVTGRLRRGLTSVLSRTVMRGERSGGSE